MMNTAQDRDDLLDLVALALPYVEEAVGDPCNKPKLVRHLASRMRAAIERPRGADAHRKDFVPGAMRCAKCSFRLSRVILDVSSGTAGAGGNETEPCPNGCGPLWPVTWEEEARKAWATAEELFERAKRAEEALQCRDAEHAQRGSVL